MPTHLLPIFPLSSVVLFPNVRVPLHLFEPRYRQMAQAALDGDRRIGMVTVPPDQVDAMAGDPPVFPVGCEGEIIDSQALPDGRVNIILAGLHRFRIVEEPPRPADRLYRVARVEPLRDTLSAEDEPRIRELRTSLIERFTRLIRHTAPEHADKAGPQLFDGVEDVTFVNALSQLLDLPTLDKQALLEEGSVGERFERLHALIEFRLKELEQGATGSSRSIH